MRQFYIDVTFTHPEMNEYELEAFLKKEFAPAQVIELAAENGDVYEVRFEEDQDLLFLKIAHGMEFIPKTIEAHRILDKLYVFQAKNGGSFYP